MLWDFLETSPGKQTTLERMETCLGSAGAGWAEDGRCCFWVHQQFHNKTVGGWGQSKLLFKSHVQTGSKGLVSRGWELTGAERLWLGGHSQASLGLPQQVSPWCPSGGGPGDRGLGRLAARWEDSGGHAPGPACLMPLRSPAPCDCLRACEQEDELINAAESGKSHTDGERLKSF